MLYEEKILLLANLNNMVGTLKIGFQFMYIVVAGIVGLASIILCATYLFNLFFYHYNIIPSEMYISTRIICVFSGSLVRGFIPSVLNWEGGLIVSYPRYIIMDRIFIWPGSCRLRVSFIRVVSPVNVVCLGTFEYGSVFWRRIGWKNPMFVY